MKKNYEDISHEVWVSVFSDMLRRIPLDRDIIKPHLSLIDIGSGGGASTEALRRVFVQNPIVALDPNTKLHKSLTNVTFINQQISEYAASHAGGHILALIAHVDGLKFSDVSEVISPNGYIVEINCSLIENGESNFNLIFQEDRSDIRVWQRK